ncbi:MAG: hypothetical protein OXL37_16060 [Chloroflexota bacterium]|nr:hypothetical protein [Chloroflexota bacterium]MDE2959831.1 hypothetical protein [Chloroflexota bacterium]
MTERQDLLASIANTIKDYRAGEIPEPTPEHVDRWIRQFDGDVQVPILREMDYALKRTYYSNARVLTLLRTLVNHPPNRSTQSPSSFWGRAHVMDIQLAGGSQSAIRNLFGGALHYECGLNIDQITSDGQTFVYLDDALFTGNRIIRDLTEWMPTSPEKSTVYICVIASHTGGEHWCQLRVAQIASEIGKDVDLQFWRFYRFENRKYHRNLADVLWPTAEVHTEEGFEPRTPVPNASRLFTSEQNRQLLEREFLYAGTQIQGFAESPSTALKPLGFSPFVPGFGSLFVTYRNCPNNCPLALWYGDRAFGPNHPLGRWYPLFPRKTYN